MAVLGQPERLVYIAKQLQTGLTDVVAFVQKPNGVVVGNNITCGRQKE